MDNPSYKKHFNVFLKTLIRKKITSQSNLSDLFVPPFLVPLEILAEV